MTSSILIAASISEDRIPLTTFEVTFPAFCLAEVVSNRDISITVMGGLMPAPQYKWPVCAVMTATDWGPFFNKYRGRKSPFALQELVEMMQGTIGEVPPTPRAHDTWHLPYLDQDTIENACLLAIEGRTDIQPDELDGLVTNICRKVSVFRCHVVSTPPLQAMTLADQVAGYDDLVRSSDVVLPSAFEHQASPDVFLGNGDWRSPRLHGNLRGWIQHSRGFILPRPTNKQEFAVNG
jgi:hypothetical protein